MNTLVRWVGRSDRPPTRGFAVLALVTAVTTYLLIVIGGVVRVSGSGLGCGNAGGRNDWPFCQGGLLPPLQREAVIEFSHRWLAATVSTLAIALLTVAWARYRHRPAIVWTATFFVVFLTVQVILGAITVYNLLPPTVVSIHLANAELLLGCAVLLVILSRNGGRLVRARDAATTPARRLAARWMAVAAGSTYALVVSGAIVVSQGAGFACAGWPLCGNGIQLDSNQMATYNLAHRVVAGITAVLLVYAHVRAVKAFRPVRGIRVAGMAVMVMLLAQIVAGAVLVESRLPAVTRGIHEALASGLWASVILLALLVRPGMLRLEPVEGTSHLGGGRSDRRATSRPVPAGTAS